ncbi:MAG: DUF1003 domain-containing protein [Gemmatimonadaceae bacterium]
MIDPNQVPRGEDPQTTDKQPVDPSQTRREQTGRLERFALFITNAVGTIGFFFVVLAWTLGWLLFNSFAPKPYRFDPYPAFVLWLFISNVIQLFLMPLIMVGQNLQGRSADKRAEADLAINRSAEQGVKDVREDIAQLRKLVEAMQAADHAQG